MKHYGRLDFKMKIANDKLSEQVALYKNGFDNGEIGAKQYIDFLNSVDEYIEVEPPSLWQKHQVYGRFSVRVYVLALFYVEFYR